jgi:nitric oxide reductase NorD protein
VILLGEAMNGVARSLGVAAFSSNTRRDCRFTVLKGFSEPWEKGQRRVVALRPAGYTRIGPALRHATTLLARCEAQRKLLILLSDGRPTDFDRYEGRYGVADVRRATQEAHDRGVHTFALAVEREASAHLAAMFGVGHHRVLQRPDGVADALGEVLLRGLR